MIVRAPQGRVASVEIKPHSVGVEGVSIEICVAQIIDVSAFDPRCPMAAQIAATQRARLPGAE